MMTPSEPVGGLIHCFLRLGLLMQRARTHHVAEDDRVPPWRS